MNREADIAEPEAWWHGVNKADFLITLVLLAIFALGFVLALEWKPLAAYFPLGVTIAGTIASAVFLIRVLIPARREDRAEANAPKEAPSSTDQEQDAPSPTDQEYEFFKSLTLTEWFSTICWLGGFFVFLAVFGIFAALVVFTVGYLRFQAEKSWLFAGLYAAISAGLVYVIFTLTLSIPLPEGIFGS